MEPYTYFSTVTRNIKNKQKKHRFNGFVPKEKRLQNKKQLINLGILGGSFYKKYSKDGADLEEPISMNSLIKARLQGNILDVIKRNAQLQECANQATRSQDTVMELPSSMFSKTNDVPNISLFESPPRKLPRKDENFPKVFKVPNQDKYPYKSQKYVSKDESIDLQSNFAPKITSTPFLPSFENSYSNRSNDEIIKLEKELMRSDSIVTNVPSLAEKLHEKHSKMCEIVNTAGQKMNSILFKNCLSQIENSKTQIQAFMGFYFRKDSTSTCTSKTDFINSLNKTFVIDGSPRSTNDSSMFFDSLDEEIDGVRNESMLQIENSNHQFDKFLTQTIKKPFFLPEVEEQNGCSLFINNLHGVFTPPLQTQVLSKATLLPEATPFFQDSEILDKNNCLESNKPPLIF